MKIKQSIMENNKLKNIRVINISLLLLRRYLHNHIYFVVQNDCSDMMLMDLLM